MAELWKLVVAHRVHKANAALIGFSKVAMWHQRRGYYFGEIELFKITIRIFTNQGEKHEEHSRRLLMKKWKKLYRVLQVYVSEYCLSCDGCVSGKWDH